jgi:DNA-binding MarR family transcriptional regulator
MDRIERSEYFFGNVLLLANKLQIWGDTLVEDVTFKQLFLLLLISKMETKEPTVTELANFAGTSRQNVKKMLESLKSKGYVYLDRSESDTRALNIRLTDKALDYFLANTEKAANAVAELFSDVSEEELSAAVIVADKLLTVLENKNHAES